MLKVLIAAAALTLATPAWAQDPAPAADATPLIDEAKAAYGAGETSHARQALEKALASVVVKQAGEIRTILPAPFDGWTVHEGDATNMALMAAGAGMTVERSYVAADGTSEVRIAVVADSNMVESMAEVYDNPIIQAGGEIKVEQIAGQKAIIDNNGEITIIIDRRSSFTISGNATPEVKKSYAENIKFDAFRALK